MMRRLLHTARAAHSAQFAPGCTRHSMHRPGMQQPRRAFANSATAALKASVSFSCSISADSALLSTLLQAGPAGGGGWR